ncbi:glycosyltransferase family 39 protein, partial [Enterobacter hormaechei]|nr:glycosyltransferase family 39 protein [Enterobacter hormaechei]
YLYAYITSLYTNILDMRLLGAILKMAFIIALYFVFKKLSGRKGKSADFIFIALSLLLVSSSNLSMFNSFYQEQVLLICIPLIIIYMERRDTKGIVLMYTFLAILTTSKSQFALTPLIFILHQVIFDRHKLKLKISLSLLCLLLGVLCITFSKGAVSLNKYHSNYYGIYQLMKNNKVELPENVDLECVGVDAWGNKYDIAKGALS